MARAAIELIEVDWEVLEPLVDPDDAVEREQLLGSPRRYERGDLERGLAEADAVVEAEYRTQVALHNCMEPHGAVCRWEGDTLEVYISTQFIWGVRADVAEQLGLPEDRVRVVCNFMGGGFGSKNGPREHTYVAAELSKRTGRAVRCFNDRREENLDAGNRNGTIQRLVAGARADGTLTALGGDFVNAVGFGGFSASTSGPMQMLYACPNVRTTEYGAKLNTPPNAAFRAPGFVEGTFGLECLLDELAARLELDPLEFRRRNHADSDLDRRAAVLVQEPDRVLPPRASPLGPPRRGARALRPDRGSAASGSRARSGTAAAARPRTRGCASARTAARRSSPRCRTSARAPARRWRRSPQRSSASRSSASASSSATRRAAHTPRSRPARRPFRASARPCAQRRPTRRARSSRSPRSAMTSRSASSR